MRGTSVSYPATDYAIEELEKESHPWIVIYSISSEGVDVRLQDRRKNFGLDLNTRVALFVAFSDLRDATDRIVQIGKNFADEIERMKRNFDDPYLTARWSVAFDDHGNLCVVEHTHPKYGINFPNDPKLADGIGFTTEQDAERHLARLVEFAGRMTDQ